MTRAPSWFLAGRVRKRRERLAADDRRGLVNELIVLESLHHEHGKVDAAGEVALQDGVAHEPAPHGQAMALRFLERTLKADPHYVKRSRHSDSVVAHHPPVKVVVRPEGTRLEIYSGSANHGPVRLLAPGARMHYLPFGLVCRGIRSI